MTFYKVEAEIINARTFIPLEEKQEDDENRNRRFCRNFRSSDEWKNFKEFSSQHSDEIYQKSAMNTYIFAVGIRNETFIQLGILTRSEIDELKLAEEFMALIDAKFKNPISTEVTLRAITDMLSTSSRHSLISDDDEVLEKFGLDNISNRHSRSIDFSEVVYQDELNEKELIEKSDSLLCSETLIPEIERIYQIPSEMTESGHPVHYMMECNDSRIREKMTKVLLTSLYNNKRIRSRRRCVVTFDTDYAFHDNYFDALCRSYFGSAMVLHYNQNSDDDGEYANPNCDFIEKLCCSIKKFKNDVLMVICLPRANEKIKNAFIEHLGTITVVPIKEDVVFGEKAKNYLRRQAKKQGTKSDKSLYSTIRDNEKGYLATELNIIFDKWYAKKLKTKIYPQYAEFESACNQIVKNKPKGSAYSEMEKMIGLSEAKDVINQALDFYKAQKLYKDKGIPSESTAMHMVFTGNPGTAKTSAARLFAQIMKENGLLSEGTLHEVGRADLVGRYVGWTAQIVKQKFKDAKGSVLFIDEAYSLVDDKDGLYGDEAINTIVQEMENNREDMVVIFAGYPDKMEEFLRKNPGLRSRIAFHIPFNDYKPEELFQITKLLSENKKLTLADDVEEKLIPIFETHLGTEDFGNGRFARNLLEKAQRKQASRLVSQDPDSLSKEDVLTLTAEDFEAPAEVKKETRTIGF